MLSPYCMAARCFHKCLYTPSLKHQKYLGTRCMSYLVLPKRWQWRWSKTRAKMAIEHYKVYLSKFADIPLEKEPRKAYRHDLTPGVICIKVKPSRITLIERFLILRRGNICSAIFISPPSERSLQSC